MKRVISFILILVLALPSFSAFAESPWGLPDNYYKNEPMKFLPENNYYSIQNGPSFTWPIVHGAIYDLIVCKDKELKDIAYKAEDLKLNLYTFPYVFEAGREYYWSVRYKKGGTVSSWQTPRRFYIDSDAFPFTVPDIKDIGKNLNPHPRFYNKEDLNKIKMIDKDTEDFKRFKSTIDSFVNTSKYSDVVADNNDSWGYTYPADDLLKASMMYLATNDKKYSDYVIKGFEKNKDLKASDYFEWGANSDREECVFAYKAAIAYDIVYNLMTESERKNAISLIERQLERPYKEFCKEGKFERSLYERPYGSHDYRLNQAVVAGIAIYNESEIARKLVDFHLPLLATLMYPFAYQDGSSGQGPFYGLPVDLVNVAIFLDRSGAVKLLDRAYIKNTIMNFLYLWPTNWISSVGDSYNSTPESTFQCKLVLLYISSFDKTKNYREYGKWMLNRVLGNNTQYYYTNDSEYMAFNANKDTLIKAPDIMPNAAYFPDTGWIGMYSDLKDDNRVGMTFKSSWYGSHNHSHPDQNSFVIEGYGKELLRDSDYYDYYHSNFDMAYNKKTYAHNAITYDGGLGQPADSIKAKGEITSFVNGNRYKLASGDATKAYRSALTKAKRDIIYIEPETFIVIDDLENKGVPTSFEYWLNTTGDIGFYSDNKGARITNDDVMLEALIHYPKNVESNYIDYFAGPDLVKVMPPKMATNATDKRLYFKTDKTEKTKIITTLDVHKDDVKPRNVKSEEFKDYIKLSFETGDILYVNKDNKEEIITNDGISFKGLGCIYSKDNIMLIEGTNLKIDGEEIISSDDNISISVNKDYISVSAVNKDATIKVLRDNKPNDIIKQDKDRFYDIKENEEKNGIFWKYDDNYLTFEFFPGTYSMYLSKEALPGKEGSGVFKVYIDDKLQEIPYNGVYDVNNKLTKDIYIDNLSYICVVEDFNNVSSKNLKKNELFILNPETNFYITGDNPYIKLKTLSNKVYDNVITDEPKDIEASVDYKIRATDYCKGGKGSSVVWWDRINNNTLQNLNMPLMDITYEFDVKKEGNYDIIMSVSTVSLTTSDKVFNLNGNMGIFNIPKTEKYSDLQAVRVKSNIHLKEGKNYLTITNIDSGQCIFDWIGLIDSNK